MKDLKEMKRDEKYAPKEYKKIKEKLKSKRDKNVISGIIKEEKEHYKKVVKIIKRQNQKKNETRT